MRVLEIEDFLLKSCRGDRIILDVRSEKEYEKAHIPDALNLPLLNDEHRHRIGIVYKKEGRQAAVLKGFELVGPGFHQLIKDALRAANGAEVYVYCWRGGMRSNIMAWLLNMAGLRVTLLKNGYKAYRHWVIKQIEKPLKLVILGGKTGSGKTEILKMLKESGEQIIDLEALASHKGSAFGLLGMPPQPTQEFFENLLAHALEAVDPSKICWIENESRGIGRLILPNPLYDQMRTSPVIEVQVDRRQRENRINKEYCIFPVEKLAEHTKRIEKRLGGQNLKAALNHLENGNLPAWLTIVLDYYDKTYTYSNNLRDLSLTKIMNFNWEQPEQCLIELKKVKDLLDFKNVQR